MKTSRQPGNSAIERRLQRTVEAIEDRAVAQLGKAYLAAADRMKASAVHFKPTRSWLVSYMSVVALILQQLSQDAAAIGLRASHRAYTLTYYVDLWMLARSTTSDAPLSLARPRGVSSLLEDAYDDLIASLLGKDYVAQFADTIDLMIPEIKLAISNGMTAGEGMDDIMRRVRDVMGLETDRRRGPVGSAARAGYRKNFNRVQAITRTTVNTASNTGAWEAYQRNTDVLTGYEWSVSPSRVCPDCQALNGTIYPLSDTFRPPKHPNCRCTIKPVIDPKWQASSGAQAPGFYAFMNQLNAGADLDLIDW